MSKRQQSSLRRLHALIRRHGGIAPGLVLLAAIVGQAIDDADRGDVAAAAWLRGVGF